METIIMVISAEIHSSSMQGPSASAYVTYYRPEDALKAIQAVNNIFIDGRTLKGRNLPPCPNREHFRIKSYLTTQCLV